MALITTGAAVGQISGRVAGNVFSRNRYGSYIRNGTKPTVSTTSYAMAQKARLGNISGNWQSLSLANRQAWQTWAQNHPVLNRLGQTIVLTGHAAYVQINARIDQAGGSWIAQPPILAPPSPLLTFTLTADIGAGTCDIAFTATPLAANHRLWAYGAVVTSAGINYTRNLEKLHTISAAAQASPYDYQSDIEARFGSLMIAQKVVMYVAVLDDQFGLISLPLRAEATVVTT